MYSLRYPGDWPIKNHQVEAETIGQQPQSSLAVSNELTSSFTAAQVSSTGKPTPLDRLSCAKVLIQSSCRSCRTNYAVMEPECHRIVLLSQHNLPSALRPLLLHTATPSKIPTTVIQATAAAVMAEPTPSRLAVMSAHIRQLRRLRKASHLRQPALQLLPPQLYTHLLQHLPQPEM